MKAMKLYDGGERLHRELVAQGIEPGTPLRVSQLTSYDQFHYFGTAAVDEAINTLSITKGLRVLDIGAGLGGPARYIAEKTGAHVTAIELQQDLYDAGRDLTLRCGLSSLVEHRCGNVLEGVEGKFDAIISMLCFLHIPPRQRLLSICRAALRQSGKLYIEDYAKRRPTTTEEAQSLATKVQCSYLPTAEEYRQHLGSAGFEHIEMRDVTAAWTSFTAERLAIFRKARPRHVAIHGEEAISGLEDFYATVAGLFASGAISGLKIIAS
jgi:sarcosine/dimethylglycine N-methyltransferase